MAVRAEHHSPVPPSSIPSSGDDGTLQAPEPLGRDIRDVRPDHGIGEILHVGDRVARILLDPCDHEDTISDRGDLDVEVVERSRRIVRVLDDGHIEFGVGEEAQLVLRPLPEVEQIGVADHLVAVADVTHIIASFLINRHLNDWFNALNSQKGVYVITDTATGKLYVGSATADKGMLLKRWTDYVKTLHGGDVELRKLVDEKGEDYVREYFQYTLLENYNQREPDEKILSREKWWKDALTSREFGYNDN